MGQNPPLMVEGGDFLFNHNRVKAQRAEKREEAVAPRDKRKDYPKEELSVTMASFGFSPLNNFLE